MPRPPVDIVVPFVGTDDALAEMVELLERLDLIDDDTVTIADNRPYAGTGERQIGRVTVRGASGQPSSYWARNRGAEGGENPWIVFIDADVVPEPGLLAAYFDPMPADADGLLIGGIVDAPFAGEEHSLVERHALSRGAVGHETTLRDDGFTTAQTANAAVRRAVFDELGGFSQGIRSGGDAELSIRVQRAGYRLVPRFEAQVLHRSRTTLKGFIRQYARYGAGSEWIEIRYPGFSPRPHPLRVLKTLCGRVARAALAIPRGRPADAPMHLLDGVRDVAFYAGRFASNGVGEHPAPIPEQTLAGARSE